MPVAAISGEMAYQNLRRSRDSLWPDERVGDKRLSGLVRLALHPSFGFSHEDRILTLGSCFARGLENRLYELGFDVPMKQVCIPAADRQAVVDPDLLTKFTIQSIENELRWAAGDRPPEPETLFLEVSDGRWHDPQLISGGSALPLAEAIERRAAIQAAVGQFPQCRIVIVTLGLAEAWFDEESELYLNTAPAAAAVRRWPGRFQMHVLSHDDILGSLERVHAILRDEGHSDVRMLVTVSPVPLKATFSGGDVIAANAYSKAVQCAACRSFVERCAGVDYFPSYEIVVMSDRELAYEIDNMHVAPGMVRHIMNEVLGAYAPEVVTEPVAAEVAGSRRGDALGGHYDHLVKAKHLCGIQRYAEAAEVCEDLLERFTDLSPVDLAAARSVYSAALRGQARWAEAAAQLELAAALDLRGGELFYKLGQCREKLGRFAEAAEAFGQAVALDSARPEYGAGLERVQARARGAA